MPTASAAIEMRPPSRIFIESMKPPPSRAEQVLGRNAAVLHDERARVGRAHPELVLLLADPDPGIVQLDDEGRDPVAARASDP